MTSAELAKEVFAIVERKIASDRSSIDFEMAYQIRVANEKIRFAIKAIDAISPAKVNEVSLQLLDALDRLENVDRRFQDRTRLQRRHDSYPGSAGPGAMNDFAERRGL
jgi:hypothetical protein